MATDPRVLVITPDYPPARGGIQILMHRIATNLPRMRVDVVTLADPEKGPSEPEAGVRVHRPRALPLPRAGLIAQLNALGVAQALRARPAVVLSGHIVTAPAAAAVRRLLGVPFVQYVYAEELGAKPQLARFALRHAVAVIAISRYTAELARGLGASEQQLRLIPVGVDLPAGVQRAPAARPTLVTVSRMQERYKGHDVIIRALPLVRAAIPDVEWVVIGEGPLRPALEEMVAVQGLSSNVRFVGSVSDQERDRWLARAHAFAMPSRLPAGGFAGEGYGIAYLEANAHGLPVLAGDAGGALDAVVHGETGLLVDAADHLEVAAAIVELLGKPQEAIAMGRAGARRAHEFAWPRVAAQVEQLLLEVASGSADGPPRRARTLR